MVRWIKTSFFLSLLLTVIQNPTAYSTHPPKYPTLTTISGGVSLGAYEAGFMFYLIEANKKNQIVSLPVFTGASAGAINSLLSAIQQCQNPISDYEDSVFWKFWIPIGFNTLTQKYSSSPHALFSHDVIDDRIAEIKRVAKSMRPGFCKSYLAFTLTRKEPVSVQLSRHLRIPKFSETVYLRFQNSPGSSRTGIKNIQLQDSHASQILLPFTGDFDRDFDQVVNAISASAAFPMAFEPVPVSYCEKTSTEDLSCNNSNTKTSLFVDGGIYDNQPLKAAAQIAQGRFSKKAPILLIDPVLYDFYRPTESEQGKDSVATSETGKSLLSYLGGLGHSLVLSARKAQVIRLVDDLPRFSNRIQHSTSELPLNGSSLYAFMGFFEEDFRKNDFIYGMHDAKKWLRRITPKNIRSKSKPENQSTLPWRRFNCISRILDGAIQLNDGCQFMLEKEERNSLILLQVALERLYRSCEEAPELISTSPHCLRAYQKNEVPILIEKSFPGPSRFNPRPSELAEFLDLLENYQFHFKDLGLSDSDSSYATQRINQELLSLVHSIADRQPSPEKTLIRTASRPLINAITTYTPMDHLFYVNIGLTQELGWSKLISYSNRPTPFRYGFSLRTSGLTTLISGQKQFILTPLFNLEYEFNKLSNAAVQFRLGVQMGRQFGSDDSWGGQSCTAGVNAHVGWACSAWTINPAIIITALDKFRFQAGPLIYPLASGPSPIYPSIQLGYQF